MGSDGAGITDAIQANRLLLPTDSMMLPDGSAVLLRNALEALNALDSFILVCVRIRLNDTDPY